MGREMSWVGLSPTARRQVSLHKHRLHNGPGTEWASLEESVRGRSWQDVTGEVCPATAPAGSLLWVSKGPTRPSPEFPMATFKCLLAPVLCLRDSGHPPHRTPGPTQPQVYNESCAGAGSPARLCAMGCIRLFAWRRGRGEMPSSSPPCRRWGTIGRCFAFASPLPLCPSGCVRRPDCVQRALHGGCWLSPTRQGLGRGCRTHCWSPGQAPASLNSGERRAKRGREPFRVPPLRQDHRCWQ